MKVKHFLLDSYKYYLITQLEKFCMQIPSRRNPKLRTVQLTLCSYKGQPLYSVSNLLIQESSQAESDDELFAAGGTVKSTKSKEAEADDSDESMEDDDEKEEQPRKVMSSPYYLILTTYISKWSS